jgi:hypothetical protein
MVGTQLKTYSYKDMQEKIFTGKFAVDEDRVRHSGRLLLKPVDRLPVQRFQQRLSLSQQLIWKVAVEHDLWRSRRQTEERNASRYLEMKYFVSKCFISKTNF